MQLLPLNCNPKVEPLSIKSELCSFIFDSHRLSSLCYLFMYLLFIYLFIYPSHHFSINRSEFNPPNQTILIFRIMVYLPCSFNPSDGFRQRGVNRCIGEVLFGSLRLKKAMVQICVTPRNEKKTHAKKKPKKCEKTKQSTNETLRLV